jgi:hypothetical protein
MSLFTVRLANSVFVALLKLILKSSGEVLATTLRKLLAGISDFTMPTA